MVAGQGGGPGREGPDLPRPRQRPPQPVRRLLEVHQGRLRPQPRRPGTATTNTKYWGEYYIHTQIDLAPNAVVILNRLCYASGNSEWGRANPTKTVAKQRVQNYASGFLRAGARAVFAEGDHERVVHPVRPVQDQPRRSGRSSRARPNWNGALRLPVPVHAEQRVPGLDGPEVARPVLPIGGRQLQPDRGARPRQLTHRPR